MAFENGSGWSFANHETVAASPDSEETQDIVWKFNLPNTECPKILKTLNQYNLNSYSLFGTEESLAESLSAREFVIRADHK
jgi:hypothetical protein